MTSLKIADIHKAAELLAKNGFDLIAPVKRGEFTQFQKIEDTHEIDFSAQNPRNSIKEFVFPVCEPLFSYRKKGSELILSAVESLNPKSKVAVLGARPCDAAALVPLTKLFNWDYRDDFFNRRLEQMSVVSVACSQVQETCFCTSVGGGPDNPSGSDMMLKKSGEFYILECHTGKGRAIKTLLKPLLKDTGCNPEIAVLESRFDAETVRKKLKKNPNSDRFHHFSAKCLQCGICSYLCPTCHCFDITDQGTHASGYRFRNYDSCQFAAFTLHTSGFNPRPDKASRWRQRIMHKFVYFPDQFDSTGCVGCGRCVQSCPVGMNLVEQLEEFSGTGA